MFLRFVVACILLLGLAGCAHHAVKAVIPAHCMKVKITDFGAPCLTQSDGSMICDKVHVRTNCIEAAQ